MNLKTATACVVAMLMLCFGQRAEAQRITSGLAAFYDFSDGSGSTVSDSEGGTPLSIQDPSHVTWLPGGGLQVHTPTTMRETGFWPDIYFGLESNDEMTFEAWIVPDNVAQTGMIASCGGSSTSRSFAISQDGTDFGAFVRTNSSSTGNDGSPEFVESGSAGTSLIHILRLSPSAIPKLRS